MRIVRIIMKIVILIEVVFIMNCLEVFIRSILVVCIRSILEEVFIESSLWEGVYIESNLEVFIESILLEGDFIGSSLEEVIIIIVSNLEGVVIMIILKVLVRNIWEVFILEEELNDCIGSRKVFI